jgi:hypothetical protein
MVRSIHALIFAAASGSSTRSAALLPARSSFTRWVVVTIAAGLWSSLAGGVATSFYLARCAWLSVLPRRRDGGRLRSCFSW